MIFCLFLREVELAQPKAIPPSPIISAIFPRLLTEFKEFFSGLSIANSDKLFNKYCAVVRKKIVLSTVVFGRARPVAMASPEGFGIQNSAGLTKANSSSISRLY